MEIIPRKMFLDDLLDDFIPAKREQSMKCDIYEKEGDYHIEMDVPGFNKEDISVETKDGYLIISATKNNEVEEKDEEKNYIRRERSYGEFKRSFYLGDLDDSNIDASFDNGVLNIKVPKKEAVSNKKVIEIK